MEPFRSNKISL
uniref:Uncharacterized protein n=1 Tax=Rhizophora mucronata TaxID=61149 RepID=A0A2P2QI78_RHIMU